MLNPAPFSVYWFLGCGLLIHRNDTECRGYGTVAEAFSPAYGEYPCGRMASACTLEWPEIMECWLLLSFNPKLSDRC